jgi:hypothetical protein
MGADGTENGPAETEDRRPEPSPCSPDGRPWIDDDLAGRADDVVEWLEAHSHVLVVAPDLFTGLRHQHRDEIEAWR